MPFPPGFSSPTQHDALPLCLRAGPQRCRTVPVLDAGPRGHVRVADAGLHPRSEEHTSELQSLRHLVCRFPPVSQVRRSTTLSRSAFGLALNAVGLFLFWMLGRGATFGSLMPGFILDRKSTRLNSSHLGISYAVSPRFLKSDAARRSPALPSGWPSTLSDCSCSGCWAAGPRSGR